MLIFYHKIAILTIKAKGLINYDSSFLILLSKVSNCFIVIGIVLLYKNKFFLFLFSNSSDFINFSLKISIFYTFFSKNENRGFSFYFHGFLYVLTPFFEAYLHLAGVERIELPSKVLETPMLPLYHTPVCNLIILQK